MSVCRSKKSSSFFTLSNKTAQNKSLSYEALGILTECISMPENWEFHPKNLWKSRDCGRDRIYKRFNELIEHFHCIRIRIPNPKAKNLPGEIEYEFFADQEDCKARIKELKDNGLCFDSGNDLKKCFRHPDSQDPEPQDPNSQDTTKDRVFCDAKNSPDFSKKQTTKQTTSTPTPLKEVEEVSSKEIDKQAKRMKSHVDKFIKIDGDKWNIPIHVYHALIEADNFDYVTDQLNNMLSQQKSAKEDEANPYKKDKDKTKPVGKPKSYLINSCRENWALSPHKKKETK